MKDSITIQNIRDRIVQRINSKGNVFQPIDRAVEEVRDEIQACINIDFNIYDAHEKNEIREALVPGILNLARMIAK